MHQFRWFSEGGGVLFNWLQKEGVPRKGEFPQKRRVSTLEETMTLYSKSDQAYDLWQQLKLASELEYAEDAGVDFLF